MARSDPLQNKYNIAVARAQDLQEQLRIKTEQWDEIELKSDTTAKLCRDLCEEILGSMQEEHKLGVEYSWGGIALNDLIEKAREGFKTKRKNDTEFLKGILEEGERRRQEIESLNEQIYFSMSTGAAEYTREQLEKAAEADKERREALGRAGAQYKNAVESGAADVVSKEGLDYEPPEEKDVTSVRLNDRAIPVGAPRGSSQDKKKEVSTHVINLGEWEEKLKREQMAALVSIGASGLSTYREIEEDIIKATPNASKNKLREGIRSMATMGILDEEQAVTPKARVYLYALTDVGKRLYKAKTGRDPVVSELENMRREHNNPSHGLSIRYTAEALRDSGIYRSVTYETGRKGIDVGGGQAYIPDIICEEENGRKLYIEYETGTTGQRKFNNKCNKMCQVSQVLLFMAPNREVAEKLVAEVKSWINNCGAGALENVEVRICAAQRVLKGARLKDDTTWNFIFKPGERGDDPIVN